MTNKGIFMAKLLGIDVGSTTVKAVAITEAAVGSGITTLLMFVALKKLHAIKTQEEHDDKD